MPPSRSPSRSLSRSLTRSLSHSRLPRSLSLSHSLSLSLSPPSLSLSHSRSLSLSLPHSPVCCLTGQPPSTHRRGGPRRTPVPRRLPARGPGEPPPPIDPARARLARTPRSPDRRLLLPGGPRARPRPPAAAPSRHRRLPRLRLPPRSGQARCSLRPGTLPPVLRQGPHRILHRRLTHRGGVRAPRRTLRHAPRAPNVVLR